MFLLQSQGESLIWATFQGSKRAVLQLNNWFSVQTWPEHVHFQKWGHAWYLQPIWKGQSQLTLQTQHSTHCSIFCEIHSSSFLCNLASNQSISKMPFLICQVKTTYTPNTKYSISTKANNLITETICLIFLSKCSDSSCTALAASQVWRKEGGGFFFKLKDKSDNKLEAHKPSFILWTPREQTTSPRNRDKRIWFQNHLSSHLEKNEELSKLCCQPLGKCSRDYLKDDQDDRKDICIF